MFRVEIIKNFDDLKAYEKRWNELALKSRQEWPMLSYAWNISYLEHMLDDDEQWACLLALNGEELWGVLLLIVRYTDKSKGRPSGLRLPLLSDLVILAGTEAEVLPALLSALEKAFQGWSCLAQGGLKSDSPFSSIIKLKYNPVRIIVDSDGYGSFSKIKGSFESFFDSLGGNHRRNLKKAENKLEKYGQIVYRFLEGPQAIPDYLDTFIRLEAGGYKGTSQEGGSAIGTSPRRVAFKKALINRLYDLNCLEWHIMEAAGTVIAMQMVFRAGQTLTLYKICYDENYSSCSPGKMLALQMFKRAYSSGKITGINWITDLPFHELWLAEKQAYYVYYLYPRRISPYFSLYLPRKIWTPLRDSRILGAPLRDLHALLRGKRQ